MGLFTRRCPRCRGNPKLDVAAVTTGHAGGVDVELRNLPYRACPCGQEVKWAFDPGLDFAEQIDRFLIAAHRRIDRVPACAECGEELAEREVVELRGTAKVADYAPIEVRAHLAGYRCSTCGLVQAEPGAWDLVNGVAAGDGSRALHAAVAALGLPR